MLLQEDDIQFKYQDHNTDKEVYLILMVHGMGSMVEIQRQRQKEIHAGFKKVV